MHAAHIVSTSAADNGRAAEHPYPRTGIADEHRRTGITDDTVVATWAALRDR